MQGKVDFSKGAFSQDFSDSVEVYSGHRHLSIFLEAVVRESVSFPFFWNKNVLLFHCL